MEEFERTEEQIEGMGISHSGKECVWKGRTFKSRKGNEEKGVHINRKWMGGETTLKSLWNSDLRGGKLV